MRCSRNSFSFLRNSRSCGEIMATDARTCVCGASGGALDADGGDDAGPSGIGADTDASPRLFVPATRGAMIAFSIPGLRRLAILANATNFASVREMGEVQAAARMIDLEVVTSEIERAEDIAPVFAELKDR